MMLAANAHTLPLTIARDFHPVNGFLRYCEVRACSALEGQRLIFWQIEINQDPVLDGSVLHVVAHRSCTLTPSASPSARARRYIGDARRAALGRSPRLRWA